MNRLNRAGIRSMTFAFLMAFVIEAPASADSIRISVTNDQPSGGFAISPVWFGVQSGGTSTFTPSVAASASLQALAELGDSSKLATAFDGRGPQGVAGTTPLTPGASASTILDVADPASHPYLNFAAMVVPSNDFFFGNADPKGFRLFDASGQFVGPTTIQVFGHNAWDAGTEVDNIQFGAAFIAGENASDHVAASGVITPVFGGPTDLTAYLNSIHGKATPAGYDIGHVISPDDLIATITITRVPEPSTFVLFGIGVVALLHKTSRNRLGITPPSTMK
ncbi:spondin domain-containing protein [Singulisphaera rosea]